MKHLQNDHKNRVQRTLKFTKYSTQAQLSEYSISDLLTT